VSSGPSPLSHVITASMLYNLVTCPHRVTMDLFADPAERDPANPFVELLWERGSAYEAQVMGALGVPFLDLSDYTTDEKERRTTAAMDARVPLIYNGRIQCANLLGVPDLLRLEAGGYVPGDIKSGAGEEGPDDESKPKRSYAVQLALYVDVLERQGRLAERRAFVWDIHGDEVPYDLLAPQGKRDPRSLWQDYQDALAQARPIAAGTAHTRPARAAGCKLCHWYTSCTAQLEADDDLTLLPELGRAKRDVLRETFPTVHELAAANLTIHVRGAKTSFPGIGPETLLKFHARAKLHATGGAPYAKKTLSFPARAVELFYDVETDPMQDICYLHGFVVRENGNNSMETYVGFFADEPTAEGEERVFRDAYAFIHARQPCALFYYSPYERTTLAKLATKYPGVCSQDDVAELFASPDALDLYHGVVRPHTEWPTSDMSIKTLARRLGFSWRDANPSGAASIQWFAEYLRTRDPAGRQRILDYNEDDCRAMRVLLDGLKALPVIPADTPGWG
jgi:predicted RecB family nuclease